MNPLKLFRIYQKADKVVSLIEEGTKSYERTQSMSKSLFVSKTFWFNILTAVVDLTGVLPLPQGVATTIASVGNIAIRTITSDPVHIVPPK